MPQFKAWRKKTIDAIERRQARVIGRFMTDMDRVMEAAVDYVCTNFEKSERFKAPPLREMYKITSAFYENVTVEAIKTTETTKSVQTIKVQKSKKHLAAAPKAPLPKGQANIRKIFGNAKYWQRVNRRSKALTDKMKTQYIDKLRKAFDEIVPEIREGRIDAGELKKHMMESWKASKSRVETVFRTETTNYFSRAQISFFSDDKEIIGFLFDSVSDTARTEICRSRDGLVYRPGSKELHENTPALHYNCRSHLIALANTPENRKLLEDPQRDPRNRKVAPLPPGWKN